MLEVSKWVLTFIIVMLISVPLNGLVISATWGWFVSPITGARHISLTEGVGLSIFLSVAGSAVTASIADRLYGSEAPSNRYALIIRSVVGPVTGLIWGWLWFTFAM